MHKPAFCFLLLNVSKRMLLKNVMLGNIPQIHNKPFYIIVCMSTLRLDSCSPTMLYVDNTLSLTLIKPLKVLCLSSQPPPPPSLLVNLRFARSFSVVPLSTRTWSAYSWLESSPATVARPRVVVSISSGCGTSGKDEQINLCLYSHTISRRQLSWLKFIAITKNS